MTERKIALSIEEAADYTGIGTEIKQREPAIAETEQRITELEQQLEKGRLIDCLLYTSVFLKSSQS